MIETAFREPGGKIAVLAATTTVAAGINTPASTVIIAEQEFIGEDGRAFTVAEYKNMAGRAGRLGFQEQGKSIIFAETRAQRAQLFQRYVLGRVESMESSFDQQNLNTWVVRLLGQVKAVPRSGIVRLLANTYGGYLAATKDAAWANKMELQVTKLTERMLSLGLLEEEGELVRLTLLGKACAASSLSFESSLRLVELVRNFAPGGLKPLTLVALIQILQESDDVYTPLFKRGQGEAKRVGEAQARYGNALVTALQRHAGDQFNFYARCKRAAVLFDWIAGVAIEDIEKIFSYTPIAGAIYAGDIRRFADNARFHLRSAYQIAMVVSPGTLCSEIEFDVLMKQLEVGLPSDGVDLIESPFSLHRGEIMALYERGIKKVDEIWKMQSIQLEQSLGAIRAKEIQTFQLKLNAGTARSQDNA